MGYGKANYVLTQESNTFSHLVQFKESRDTLRVLVIGNSFSQNATTYLPELAKEGKHPLKLGKAQIGGGPLKKHWELSQLAESDPGNPDGKPYGGKSLRMMLSEDSWDVVTIQQYSKHSGDMSTYIPYARNIYDYIKSILPNTQVVLHQTWAYRIDSKDFTQIGEDKFAKNSKQMWKKSRATYHSMAKKLGIEIIPVGDAFRKVNSGSFKYKVDRNFYFENPIYPELPEQANSLHTGYFWKNEKALSFDSHHANDAGCFLGALVWYGYLFKDSPDDLNFKPKEVPKEFSDYLKKVVSKMVR